MDFKRRQPMGVELVKRKIVTEEDIERALQYQREHPNMKIGDILYELKACDPKTLIEAIGDILGEKGIILDNQTIRIRLTDYMSLDVAKANKAVPFEVSNDKIKVCFANTTNKARIETIRLLMLNKGLVMEKYITFAKDIDNYLLSLGGEIYDDVKKTNNDTTVTELVDSIIKTAMKRRH